jgi:CubicO group peptidase (beta-lactamase class C family)
VRWVHPAGEAPREPHGFTLGLLERHGRLRFPAGSRAAYTNLGYLALGEVISAAGGQRYEDQVRRNILVPLGMDRTDFVYRPDMVGGVRILTPDSVAAMQTIQAAGPKMEVGLGWFRRRSDRPSTERHLEHLGGGGGFFNMMRIHPDRGAGVVVMGNATAYDHQRIAASALR